MRGKKIDNNKRKYSSFSNLVYIYKSLWKYDKKIIGYVALEIIFVVIASFGAVLIPAIIIKMLEKNIELYTMVWKILLIFSGYGGVSSISTYLVRRNDFQYIEFRAGYFMELAFRKVMSIDYDNYESQKTQKLIENGISALEGNYIGIEGILHKTVLIAIETIGLVLYTILLSEVNLLIIFLLLGISIIQFISFQIANKYEMKNKEEKAELEVTKRYLDMQTNEVSVGKDIRIYQLQHWLTLKYKKVNDKYQSLVAKERIRYFANDLIGLVLQLFRDAICYGYLIILLKNGQLMVSDFVLYIGLVASFAVYFNEITANITEAERFQKMTDYFREFLDIKNRINYGEGKKLDSNEATFQVEFSHVTFTYPTCDGKEGKKVLDDVSFTMKKGEKMALVGINGAGKTTIVKLICGFYKPTSGHIYIDGIDINDLDIDDYYSYLAVVFQDAFTFSFTIAENVTCEIEDKYDKEKCINALNKSGLGHKIQKLPKQENTYLNKDIEEDGIQLSGGELQKLMLARALYKECKLLLLDEPTAALDAIAENEMYEKYEEVISGKTALFISHRLASTRFCNKILFLENGKITEEGTHEELMSLDREYAHMFNVQSQYYKEEGIENEDESILR